ncbi:MAG: nucleotidyltransferase domain-containing protein [Spirochaetota bacterium]
MNTTVINKIKNLKSKYEPEGFIILGVFGSYVRGEETENSDIDILYEMTDSFYKKYPGWDVIPVIEQIEKEFKKELGMEIDLANKNALNEIGKKYILPEVMYV